MVSERSGGRPTNRRIGSVRIRWPRSARSCWWCHGVPRAGRLCGYGRCGWEGVAKSGITRVFPHNARRACPLYFTVTYSEPLVETLDCFSGHLRVEVLIGHVLVAFVLLADVCFSTVNDGVDVIQQLVFIHLQVVLFRGLLDCELKVVDAVLHDRVEVLDTERESEVKVEL